MTDTRVLVSLVAGAEQRYDEIVRACESVGLRVDQRLEDLGVVTGLIDRSRLEALRSVAGVDAVEIERDITLPPPDSPIL